MRQLLKLTAAVAVAAFVAASTFKAQAQSGRAGPEGPAGSSGPTLVILGGTDEQRANLEAADYATADCQNKFGSTARWANTRDVKTLAWDLGDAPAAGGWIDIYPVGRLSDDRIIDFSGWIGTLDQLACGLENSNGTWTPHASIAGTDRSLTASYSGGFGTAPCSSTQGVLCVGPKP